MIVKILDFDTADKAVLIMTSENCDYLEVYLEGKFEINKKCEFQEGTRISIGKQDCNLLIGILQKWIDEQNESSS